MAVMAVRSAYKATLVSLSEVGTLKPGAACSRARCSQSTKRAKARYPPTSSRPSPAMLTTKEMRERGEEKGRAWW